MKHTPGPWKLDTVRTSVGVCHKISGLNGRLGSGTKLTHACLYDDCYSDQPRDLQLLADARLIAAAPELYQAVLDWFFVMEDKAREEPKEFTFDPVAWKRGTEIKTLETLKG